MRTLFFSALLFASMNIHAQQASQEAEKPPLPPGPVINPLPTLAEWEILYTDHLPGKGGDSSGSSDVNASSKENPRSIVITKSGKIYREIETNPEGARLERWRVGGTEISLAGDGKYAIMDYGAGGDFDELNWISPANYVNVAKVAGAPCYIFRDKISIPDAIGLVDVSAGISVSTRLPVYLVIDGVPQIYKFNQAPSAPLVVPQNIVHAILARRQTISGMIRK